MFAVVRYQGKQYIVSPGDVITVSHVDSPEGELVHIQDVLLVSDGKKTTIGTPLVSKAVVEAKVLAQKKGEKVTIRRFKSKVRYRKTRGFRPLETDIEIVRIL